MAPSGSPIRVILIDDYRRTHEAVALILSSAPGVTLVGQGYNGDDALRLCEELRPDLVLMDVVMPVMDGIQATRIIRKRFPSVKILVLSSYSDHESVYAMLTSGASGYVLKDSLTQDLIHTIRATMEGKVVLSPEAAAHMLNPPLASANRFGLTDRELEVLGLMSDGLNNAQIARSLAISESTVKFHINNVLEKLAVETRAEALVMAAKSNLI